MTQRFAEWLVAFQHAEPADASILVLLVIAWLVVMSYGVAAWWRAFFGRDEDPDWTHEGNWR